MPKVCFLPSQLAIDVDMGTKILVAGRRLKVPIRFGCGACQCGTCAVRVSDGAQLGEMESDERALLSKMGLPLDGAVRLSCRARVQGDIEVDLDFQSSYDPSVLG